MVPDRAGGQRVEALGFGSDGETVQVVRAGGALQLSEADTGVDREVKPVDFTRFAEVVRTIANFWFAVVTLPTKV